MDTGSHIDWIRNFGHTMTEAAAGFAQQFWPSFDLDVLS